MAAQKLTKGRLVQIVFMMVILLAAFTWRTVTYEQESNWQCDATLPCEIEIDDWNIKISNHSDGFLIETSKSEDLDISVEQPTQISQISKSRWLVQSNDADPVISVTWAQQEKPLVVQLTKPNHSQN